MEILEILEKRFFENMHRHPNIKWEDVLNNIATNKSALNTLKLMEDTGGEPDVVELTQGKITFVDCSKETPKLRVNCCYDEQARAERKQHAPKTSVEKLAGEIGIEVLTFDEYKKLQEFEEFDLKTSTWVKTPNNIRQLGGAIFADRRYNQVFMYHNSAETYYASRSFRGKLEL